MLKPPIKPMLAKITEALPEGHGWLYEPKWDGFRALVFRDGDDVYLQSRDLKSLNRYFPELLSPIRAELPDRCVLDGEIVIAGDRGLDFDALLQRIHPAASRVALLAKQTPASFVAWDLLAQGDASLLDLPQSERRARLEKALARAKPPIFASPATTDRAIAEDWFARFEGAGFDGVVAKRLGDKYHPDKRIMLKIKHARTADCVVGGFRWHTSGPGTLVGSLLLGLYDDRGVLHHVGVTSSFSMDRRRELAKQLEPLRKGAHEGHPWAASLPANSQRNKDAEDGANGGDGGDDQRRPGGKSRWSAGKDMSWEPVRIGLVCEVAYDHLQGDRFRHATVFKRWRPDKTPSACRYDQLEVTPPFELSGIFKRGAPSWRDANGEERLPSSGDRGKSKSNSNRHSDSKGVSKSNGASTSKGVSKVASTNASTSKVASASKSRGASTSKGVSKVASTSKSRGASTSKGVSKVASTSKIASKSASTSRGASTRKGASKGTSRRRSAG